MGSRLGWVCFALLLAFLSLVPAWAGRLEPRDGEEPEMEEVLPSASSEGVKAPPPRVELPSIFAEGIPEGDEELARFLLTHPPKDPRIQVIISQGPGAEANVYLWDGDTLVATLHGFGGPYAGGKDTRSLEGEYRIIRKLGTIRTGLYEKTLGHEFYLRDFLQIQGNYGFHAYKINDATMEEEPGPTHGCITLPAVEMAALYAWAKVGTPVTLSYVNPDVGLHLIP